MFPIPDAWKSKRQVIIELYFVERSANKVALRLGKDPSYIRKVLHAYREFLQSQQASQCPSGNDTRRETVLNGA